VSLKALGTRSKMTVCKPRDSLSPLWQAALGVRCAVRLGKELPQRPDQMAEAVPTSRLLAFQCCSSWLRLCRAMAGLLEEAPTPCPSLLGPCPACCILLGFPAGLEWSPGG